MGDKKSVLLFFCQKEKGAHEICSFVLLSKKWSHKKVLLSKNKIEYV